MFSETFKDFRTISKEIIIDRKCMITIPSITYLYSIYNVLLMLDHIYKSELNSYDMRIKDELKILGNFDLKIGFLTRIHGFTNLICTIEGILVRSFLETKKYCSKNIKNFKKKQYKHDDLREEVEDYRLWRNKVFAHTSFSSPEKYIKLNFLCDTCLKKIQEKNAKCKDNISIQLSSLENGFGSTCSVHNGYLQLPGATVSVSGESVDLPTIGIVHSSSRIVKHYEKWFELFKSLYCELESER
ncbi:MAG: hypothetical protein ABIA04_09710 [Pseudomonadota bacterium]